MPGKLVLITGLACSGKTTLAQKIANGIFQGVCVHADDLSDSAWTLADFQDRVRNAICEKLDQGVNVVYESSFLDINDPEQARVAVFESLLARANMVYIIQPDDLYASLGRLIDRCIRRAIGQEPQGSCPETTQSRAHLVETFIGGYSGSVYALAQLSKNKTTTTYMATPEEILKHASMRFEPCDILVKVIKVLAQKDLMCADALSLGNIVFRIKENAKCVLHDCKKQDLEYLYKALCEMYWDRLQHEQLIDPLLYEIDHFVEVTSEDYWKKWFSVDETYEPCKELVEVVDILCKEQLTDELALIVFRIKENAKCVLRQCKPHDLEYLYKALCEMYWDKQQHETLIEPLLHILDIYLEDDFEGYWQSDESVAM